MLNLENDVIDWNNVSFPYTLGDYTLLRSLGEGGMAKVFLADRHGAGSIVKRVAVKVISMLDGEKAVRILEQEARAGINLEHPNIVHTLNFVRVDDIYLLELEYVDGPDLEKLNARCRRRGMKIPASVIIEIAKAVCAGLSCAHDNDIIHRDLKPANVMLSKQGAVKLMDFGIAKVRESMRRVELTQTGMTKGTPAYMSPEQIQGEELDGRSDLFSLGVLLYELLVGERMFTGNDYGPVLASILQSPREPFITKAAEDDPELASCIARLIPLDRNARPTSTQETLEILESLKSEGLTLKEWIAETGILDEAPTLEAFHDAATASLPNMAIDVMDEGTGSDWLVDTGAGTHMGSRPDQIGPGSRQTKERPPASGRAAPQTGIFAPKQNQAPTRLVPPPKPKKPSALNLRRLEPLHVALAGIAMVLCVALILLMIPPGTTSSKSTSVTAVDPPKQEIVEPVMVAPDEELIVMQEINDPEPATPAPVVKQPARVKREPATPAPVVEEPPPPTVEASPVDVTIVTRRFGSKPTRVGISINGQRGVTPFGASLPPGDHTATITCQLCGEGHKLQTIAVSIPSQGGRVIVDIDDENGS